MTKRSFNQSARALELFEQQITHLMDEGLFDSDNVLDVLSDVSDEMLAEASPMVKTRMMGILSREIRAIIADPARRADPNESQYALRMKHAGQRLAILTPVPESVVTRFTAIEEQFTAHFKTRLHAAQSAGIEIDLTKDLSDETLFETARQINDVLGRLYENAFGTETEISTDPHDKNYGYAGWNDETKKLVISSNVAKTKKVADIPALVVTLGHENVHGVIATQWARPGFDPEKYREKSPDYYMLMRICDRAFYATQGPVYRKHPEEILAERVGVRLGVSMSRLLGKPNLRAEFEESARMYDSPLVAKDIRMLFPRKYSA